jgi:hypothetical protein
MEKVCKRCQFKNPQKRAICQICGHAQFVQSADQSRAGDAKVTPAVTPTPKSVVANPASVVKPAPVAKPTPAVKPAPAVNLSGLANDSTHFLQNLSKQVSRVSIPDFLKSRGEDPAQTASKLLRNRVGDMSDEYTAVTCSDFNYSSNATTPEQQLDELLEWFKSYGLDQQLILTGDSAKQKSEEQPSDDSVNNHRAA